VAPPDRGAQSHVQRIERLADDHHPLVRETAQRLTHGKGTDREKLEGLFFYVRDEIKFGFPLSGDLTPAPATIQLKIGQCNTKGTLFLVLCKVVGIPARIHFSLIDKQIQRGLFPLLMYRLLPPFLSHSWVEIEVGGCWRRIDSYINDRDFYRAGT
jgi:transglutaminase-like putative cysteine protease